MQLLFTKVKPPGQERISVEETMSLDSASDELRETFKRALRRFPAAVSVINSADQDRPHPVLLGATGARNRPGSVRAADLPGCGLLFLGAARQPGGVKRSRAACTRASHLTTFLNPSKTRSKPWYQSPS